STDCSDCVPASPGQIPVRVFRFFRDASATVLFHFGVRRRRSVAQAVTAPADLDDFGLLEEAIQNGFGRGHVAQQLPRLLEGSVRGEQRGAVLADSATAAPVPKSSWLLRRSGPRSATPGPAAPGGA